MDEALKGTVRKKHQPDILMEKVVFLLKLRFGERLCLNEGKGLLDSVGQDMNELRNELRTKPVDMDRCMVARTSDSPGVA